MRGWGWVVAGVALLALELLGIDAQFYLVFLGAAAIVVGVLTLVGPEVPLWLIHCEASGSSRSTTIRIVGPATTP